MYCMMYIQNPVYYRKFRYIQAYLEPCVTLVYSDLYHIQNPGIFRTQDIFRTLSRHILAYSKDWASLTFWETFGIFRTQASCLLRHIQAYTIMIVIIELTLYFQFNTFHTFQRNLKSQMFFDYNDVNFNAQLSLLK